jgi:hypothetical protein
MGISMEWEYNGNKKTIGIRMQWECTGNIEIQWKYNRNVLEIS